MVRQAASSLLVPDLLVGSGTTASAALPPMETHDVVGTATIIGTAPVDGKGSVSSGQDGTTSTRYISGSVNLESGAIAENFSDDVAISMNGNNQASLQAPGIARVASYITSSDSKLNLSRDFYYMERDNKRTGLSFNPDLQGTSSPSQIVLHGSVSGDGLPQPVLVHNNGASAECIIPAVTLTGIIDDGPGN